MRLATYIRERADEAFAWGPADCGKLAADWIRVVTGVDPAPWSRGTYDTAKGAYEVMRRAGHRSLEAAVTASLGEPLSHPMLAQRGDIASVREGRLILLGIVAPTGRHIVVRTPGGLVKVPLKRARKAWRCGRGD